jgi:uncharacterized protein
MSSPESVIDCLIHPVPTSDAEFRGFFEASWRDALLPRAFERGVHTPPIAECRPPVSGETRPGSDPGALETYARNHEVGTAVLVPLSRGQLQNIALVSEIAAATNRWLANTWLREGTSDLFVGSIRVNARDPQAAVTEIERWGSDPRFCQVVVTTEAVAPYGEQTYFGIWEAADAHNLPVMVVSDRARGVQPSPSPLGHTASYVEESTLLPWATAEHLASLICEGVFDRLPGLVFIFGDGGFDTCLPLLWRLTKDWRALRHEMPWVTRPPADYVGRHARFVLHPADGPPGRLEECIELYGLQRALLYGSRDPYWDSSSAADVASQTPPEVRHLVLHENFADLLRKRVAANGAR